MVRGNVASQPAKNGTSSHAGRFGEPLPMAWHGMAWGKLDVPLHGDHPIVFSVTRAETARYGASGEGQPFGTIPDFCLYPVSWCID